VLCIACATAVAALGYVQTPLLLAPLMVALFNLAVCTGWKTVYALDAAAITAVTCTALIAGPAVEPLGLKLFGPVAWLLLPIPIGVAARLRTAYLEAANARAEYAERTREEEARHRVTEERMRIARELHDVVAHHLALANAQAGAVAHLIHAEPGEAEKLAAGMAGTISSALRELKGTVGLLRQPDDPAAPLEPAPGLAQLPALGESFQSAGLSVTVTTDGEPRPLSPAVDLTAFRIIQEALTNVARHAGTREAQVRLSYGPGLLNITVTNDDGDGPATGAADPGYGLIGMRERAVSVGGRLHAGHRAAGGFEVAVTLPLQPRPREEEPAP
jgi:signal transduction histidine kinase